MVTNGLIEMNSLGDYVDESCGWLLPTGDQEAFLACIRALEQNPRLAESKRGTARLHAEEFSWKRIAAAAYAAYSCVVSTGVISE
jgi:glycosyltransferase involved in cell wall biosynthesis